jgi:hypothetical protein
MSTKISQLPVATTPVAPDAVLPVVQSGQTRQASIDQLGFLQSGTGAVTRTIQNKLRDVVSVKDFGAVGDGSTDDLTAFQNAAAAAKCVYVPSGTYKISGTVAITLQGSTWFGDGVVSSIITSSSTTLPMFTIASGLTGVQLKDIAFDRSVTALNGADGIKVLGTVGQCTLQTLRLIRQHRGLVLGPTDFSLVRNVRTEYCQSVGVYMTNTATDGACQWQLDTVLSQLNGAQGFLLISIAGPAGVTPGTWTNVATYANTGVGIGVDGTSCPINDVRIHGAFLGNDGDSELYLNTFGGSHVINSVFAELAGTSATGPALATAASNIGSGFETTSNNIDTQYNGCHASANSLDGYYLSGVNESITGSSAKNNGLAVTTGRRNGVNKVGGRVVVSGGCFGNTGAGISQQYGVFAADGNNISVVGADLTNNSTATYGATANSTYISSVANLPNTSNVNISPAGQVLVGGGATGGFGASGTINVAGGLLKNNTAYTNP